jgi:hypothetical protein
MGKAFLDQLQDNKELAAELKVITKDAGFLETSAFWHGQQVAYENMLNILALDSEG